MDDWLIFVQYLRVIWSFTASIKIDRFRAMKLKDEPITANFPADAGDITDMVENIRFVDPRMIFHLLHSTTLQLLQGLWNLTAIRPSTHFRSRNAWIKPTATTVFNIPYWGVQKYLILPLPLLDSTKEHFSPFCEVYGKPLSDKDRPSRGLFTNPDAKEYDKNNKAILVNSKVRCIIPRQECKKPRCVFAAKKLDILAKTRIKDIDFSRAYTCGSFLFPPDSAYNSTKCLTCQDPVEVQYYSSTMISFPPVCYAPEETLLNDSEIMDLKKQFAIVCPICFLCRSNGKWPSTRQPNLIAEI